ncbi:MAG: hypothetical protein MOB07_19620 [Acidobacteria bacterium]|nr:hypothetical protein [Acidobacteriota bacterium]
MSENLKTIEGESITPAGSGTPGNLPPLPPRPAYWPCVGLVAVGAVFFLATHDPRDLLILAAGLIPLVWPRRD